jgi:hypothetical protein
MFILQTGKDELGIAIDSKFNHGDVKALLQLLYSFRHSIEHLFIDSPIIELLVSRVRTMVFFVHTHELANFID